MTRKIPHPTRSVDGAPFKEFTAEERAAIEAWFEDDPPAAPFDWAVFVAGAAIGTLLGLWVAAALFFS